MSGGTRGTAVKNNWRWEATSRFTSSSTEAAPSDQVEVGNCPEIETIAREFWRDVMEYCSRCRGEGPVCLATEVLRMAAESSIPATAASEPLRH